MKKLLLILLPLVTTVAQGQFKDITVDSEVTSVQPMTGIVFWPGNGSINTDAISVEYSYMKYDDVVSEKDVYDWSVVDDLLDEIKARNHQALLRFRFAYPGRTTTVPKYIKDLADYHETEGVSEGNETWFPDWTHDELKRFTLAFYEKFGERYDSDPRLAYVQTGFGLWAEYHIYDGPFVLGETFPSKEFQKTFFETMTSSFSDTYWNISIDAADTRYTPFLEEPDLVDIDFGVFDDSFMHSTHDTENEPNWALFGRDRYLKSPAGGEFSYFSNYDQENVLNPDIGAYGTPYEIWSQDFHISYMIGNDQAGYQTIARIKEASMTNGYKFKIMSFKSKDGSSEVEVVNLGVAPIYIDAYVTVDGVRSAESLKLLAPNVPKTFEVAAGGDTPVLTISSDFILETQTIEFFGTVNDYKPYVQPENPIEEPVNVLALGFENEVRIFPTVSDSGIFQIQFKTDEVSCSVEMFDSSGKMVFNKVVKDDLTLETNRFQSGLYVIVLTNSNGDVYRQKVIVK